MPRLEYKYLVPCDLLPTLRRRILPYVDLDPHTTRCSGNEYTVRSIYFDTTDLRFYHEKMAGLRKRKKVRIRGYNGNPNDSPVFLEIKRKDGPVLIKHRCPVRYSHLKPLMTTGDLNAYVVPENGWKNSHENAQRFLYQVHRNALTPSVLIMYEREAYHYKLNPLLRITFDKNIRSRQAVPLHSLFDDDEAVQTNPKSLILEIKSDIRFPEWLSYIIAILNLRQQALSKYTMCLDTHLSNNHKIGRSLPLYQQAWFANLPQ